MRFHPIITGAIAALALAAPIAACGQAQAPTVDVPTERVSAPSALTTLIADYDTAVEMSDYDKLIDLSMPDKLMIKLAESEGMTDVSVDDVRGEVVTEITAVMKQLDAFAYDMDAPSGKPLASPTGREYYLLPTEVNMEMSGQKIRSTGATLAVSDEGRWYLLNPADAETIGLIKAAYPDLKSITIPANKMELVQ